MAGAVRISFTREPAYFAQEGLLESEDLTIIARRAERVVCMGHCSTRRLHVNGAVRRVGYLGELRLRSGEPGGIALLRQGYRFFREQVETNPAELYFTSIAADNTRARRVLENGKRLGLPAYEKLANLVTFLAPVGAGDCREELRELQLTSCDELTDFLARQAKAKNLALPWSADIWLQLERYGLAWGDFAVVRRKGKIVGAAAIWDQREVRQTVIVGYASLLAMARPVVNAWNAVIGRPRLPAPGQRLEQAALFGLSLSEPSAWPELWSRLQWRAARRGLDWLIWSRDERDVLSDPTPRVRGTRLYRSRLYSVQWNDRFRPSEGFGERTFRPEAAFL
jgi:hypothetical protein